MRRRLTRMLLLAVVGAVFHQIRQKHAPKRADASATVADATPFQGTSKGDTVTYESTAPEEAQPHTPLGL
jgi:hypothetical protein